MPGDLGQQCLKCRKRRVKCDSGQPGCLKCVKGGFECPGYIRKPAWTVQTAADIRKKQDRRKKTAPSSDVTAVKVEPAKSSSPSSTPEASSSSSSSNSSSTRSSNNPCQVLSRRAQRPKLPKLCLEPGLTTVDRESWRLVDCLMYFNYHVRPNMKLVPQTNLSSLLGLENWRVAPTTLQNTFVFGMLQHRIVAGDANLQFQSELRYYRGLSFQQMSQQLAGSDLESTILSYICVLVLLAVETQISGTKHWHCHMDAVWELTDRLEGVETLWKWSDGLRDTVVLQCYMDLVSFTTSPAWLLGSRRTTGSFLRNKNLDDLEHRLFETPCPCPLDVFQLVADTTDLRHRLYQPSTLFTPPSSGSEELDALFELPETTSKDPMVIFHQLQAFNADEWALRMCGEFQPQLMSQDKTGPSLTRWRSSTASLGKCYQAAAIVYLLRSVESTHLSTSILPDFEELQKTIAQQLPLYRDILSLHLSVLLATLGHTTNPSAGTNLWRFVIWPLFIDAYECIAWTAQSQSSILAEPEADFEFIDPFTTLNLTSDTTTATTKATTPKRDPQEVLARLRKVGRELGANSLFDAADLLEGVQLGCKYVKGWSWDDAFDERCIFVL